MHILIKKQYLIFNKYKVKCAIGKRGIGIKKKEGDFITPKGIFKIKLILYRKDRIKNLKTSLKKLAINKKFGWCDDPKSRKYNKLIKYPFKFSSEKLYRKDNIYDIILVLNFNMNPVIKYKGSAIFIHIAKNNYKSTKGCIALKKNGLIKLIKDLKNNTKVKVV
jgi:L,D-peptidoglycan transpeptidase YkuD (ErfK/YbiS/YcfS/YnhG family)|tara:strand:- start:1974 stop:2465 length:492 start_codon:yes stop_codon:yes gene_type:complete